MTVIVIVITTIVQPSQRDSVTASENDLYGGGILKSTLSGSLKVYLFYIMYIYWENGSFIVPQNEYFWVDFTVVVGYGR